MHCNVYASLSRRAVIRPVAGICKSTSCRRCLRSFADPQPPATDAHYRTVAKLRITQTFAGSGCSSRWYRDASRWPAPRARCPLVDIDRDERAVVDALHVSAEVRLVDAFCEDAHLRSVPAGAGYVLTPSYRCRSASWRVPSVCSVPLRAATVQERARGRSEATRKAGRDPVGLRATTRKQHGRALTTTAVLGAKLLLRRNLGSEYVEAMFEAWGDDDAGMADLCCYWHELARRQVAAGASKRVGLLATNSIRGGGSRQTLERIKDSGDIFMAWSEEPAPVSRTVQV